ncbi:hypothetical protein DFP72DRAFT_379161 [Ephemerocybe angulata]|uniref:F-box domain-containing protein n=1 Tax=Ephemerocybe angulata TaxID=980116 RepID=A0A8H6HX90_9AGAR|nr:hypothetical protein DFP72DRAFT_379161 [Tulosesus angulatus]
MPVFDFFAEFTSTAAGRPWLSAALAANQYDYARQKPSSSSSRPILHALAVNFTPYPSSTTTAKSAAVHPPSPVQMPLEIILAIIEAAYDPDAPDTSLLQSCALVCRAWSTPVQKLLFKTVSLRTASAYAAFRRAVSARPVLRDAVRRLRVVMDYSQPSYLPQHAFAHAVAMCPGLVDLDLALYGYSEPGTEALGSLESHRLRRRAPSFDAETISILRNGPSIRSLSFSNWSENQQCIFQLLDLYPTTLDSLSLSGTAPPPPPFPNDKPCFPGALERLRINYQTPPSIEFMSWLLADSQRHASLRSLAFAREPCPDLLQFLMDAFGRDLRCLALPSCGTAEHARAIEACSALEVLRMDRPQLNPLAYKSVPAAIRHLALGVERDTPLQPVIDVVKTRRELECVTVRLWSGGEGHRLLPALRIACAYRGVELRVTRDSGLYRALSSC